MSTIKKEASFDKFDQYIADVDDFKALNREKNELKEKIAALRLECEEKIRPFENELNTIIKKLELKLPKIDSGVTEQEEFIKYGRGQLGAAIKNLLKTNPEKAFKPREIATALQTKSTTVSLWFNKYGNVDTEIERIPVGEGGKRFVYKITD